MRIQDPGWKELRSGIRDAGWKKFGSGIWDKHPGSVTLTIPYSTNGQLVGCIPCIVYDNAFHS
jgi:hypothetical protein